MRCFVLLLLAAPFAACSTSAWQQHFSSAAELLGSGKYSDALAELNLALADADAADPADPELALALTYAGAIDLGLGRYGEAEVRYRRAISTYERYHPNQPGSLAVALQGLGALYTAERQWSRAEPLYGRAHDLLVQAYGPDHAAVAGILGATGELAQELGQYPKAERLYLDAMTILQRQVDRGPLDVADLEHNLATVYVETGRSEQAEELFRSAIEVYRHSAPLHPHLATILRNYADLETNQQAFAEAEKSFREALHICEASLGPESPEMAVILGSYSRLLQKINRRKEAKVMAVRSHSMLSKSLTATQARNVVDWRGLANK